MKGTEGGKKEKKRKKEFDKQIWLLRMRKKMEMDVLNNIERKDANFRNNKP